MLCPRCQGLIITNYDERLCPCCAYRPDLPRHDRRCEYGDCLAVPRSNSRFCTQHAVVEAGRYKRRA